jgi:CofD-related protein of GAK system
VDLPDPVRMARCLKAPELGPKVLFFSGGTALKDLSRELVSFTHNSIHLITPFDSGGSSAKLRDAFGMLAVGDLRNRLMALADRTLQGNPQIYDLFAHRLPKDEGQAHLEDVLHDMIDGKHPLVARIPDPMRKIVRSHLGFFREAMVKVRFDLRGASIGNLILAGGFFNYRRRIDPVVYMFSMLVKARGTVRPIVNKNLTLAAELEDGRVVAGQHRLTGKEGPALDTPILRVFLSQSQVGATPAEARIRPKTADLIRKADLICYPMGSFYSSLLANLLPKGVSEAVVKASCPKIYIPNPLGDPEQFGIGPGASVKRLLEALQAGPGGRFNARSVLDYVMIDRDHSLYREPLGLKQVEAMGVEVIETDLTDPEHAPLFTPRKVIENLLSLA